MIHIGQWGDHIYIGYAFFLDIIGIYLGYIKLSLGNRLPVFPLKKYIHILIISRQFRFIFFIGLLKELFLSTDTVIRSEILTQIYGVACRYKEFFFTLNLGHGYADLLKPKFRHVIER